MVASRREVRHSPAFLATAKERFPVGGSAEGRPSYELFERGPLEAASELFSRSFDDLFEIVPGIRAIDTLEGQLDEAVAPLSVTLQLDDDLDVDRGQLICATREPPTVSRNFEADVCWLAAEPLRSGSRYAIKHTTRTATAIIGDLVDRVDVHTLERESSPSELALNDIGRLTLRTSSPLAFDPYSHNRRTGSFILIDEASNATVGAGMITQAHS